MALATWLSLLAGAANLLGGWFAVMFTDVPGRKDHLVAVGAGFLLGGCLFSMLPSALAVGGHGALFVAAGYFGLYALRCLTTPSDGKAGKHSPEAAWGVVLAMAVHSLLDGGALGLAAGLDARLGLVAAFAMLVHKVPEGVSLAATVMATTGSRRLALYATLLIGLATMMGTYSAAWWAGSGVSIRPVLTGLAAGTFLYVGASDLMPSLRKRADNALLVLLGATLVYIISGGGWHLH